MTGAGDLDRDRLAKLLGMLGSDHDGEVVAAARQAERIRRDAGMTWHQILDNKPAVEHPRRIAQPATAVEAVSLCLDHLALLSGWEKKFVLSVSKLPAYRLTRKQLAILFRLSRGICAWEAAT